MATSWILGKVSNAIQPTIQNTVSTAGTFAGGAFDTVGSGINGVGQSINGTIKRYGDGFKDYGNGVKDWTGASGARAQTAQNPIGMTTSKAGGKQSVTAPSVYSAPKQSASKTMTTTNKTAQPQKKVAGAPVKKALPAPTPIAKKPAGTTARPPVAKKAATPATTGLARKPAGTVGTMKPSTSAVNRPKPASASKPNYVGASNPLGLT